MHEAGAAVFRSRLLRYQEFTGRRLRRALRIMSPGPRRALQLVPLFLDRNDPKIPGYREGRVPCGIDRFVPGQEQRRFLADLGLSLDDRPKKNGICALYAMGSTSSIGQSLSSDLDLWVCVRSGLGTEETRLLKEKCALISSFCKALGAEVNLFVTPEDRFTGGRSGQLDTEDCGSAQSLFLLDEFYRSSVRICGRYIAWYLISPEEEREDYAAAVAALLRCKDFPKDLFFDFGSVAASSPSEYFGSALWLLYKGIDSPFKAALKITLTEAYSAEYPNTRLVSAELKQRLWQGGCCSLNLDAYWLMFRRVCAYLKERHDPARLDLMRRCFCYKLAAGGSGGGFEQAPRLKLLRRLIRLWGWNTDVAGGDLSPARWPVPRVLAAERELFASFMRSYRALLNFSISHGIEYAITSDDAGVLSRKLYAVYDSYEGKVPVLSRGLNASLEQRDLVFLRTADNSLCRRGWHLYACSAEPYALLNSPEICFARTLTEAALWAVANGLCGQKTRIACKGRCDPDDSVRLRRFVAYLRANLPQRARHVRQADLQRPRQVTRCIAVVNFGHDATAERQTEALESIEGSSLSCGGDHLCLIGSVDLITENSWGELNCHALPDGREGVAELVSCLARLNSIGEGAEDLLRGAKVCSCSRRHAEIIRYDLQGLLNQVAWCSSDPGMKQSFELGGEICTAQSDGKRGVTVRERAPFGSGEEDTMVMTRFGMRPEYALQVPAPVENAASAGIRQYFFVQRDRRKWDIFVANEQNEISIFRNYKGSRSELVNAVNRFYTRQGEELKGGAALFNLPQYFVVSPDLASVHPFTISGRPGGR